MHILHTESSDGWGGQEIRILKESIGMRKRGHQIVFAIQPGGGLIPQARAAGFQVYEVNFRKPQLLYTLFQLIFILTKHKIQIVNTHSSGDAWAAGVVARLMKKKLIRTRHLSTPIRPGVNSLLLYKWLADFIVTTSSSILEVIQRQAKRSASDLACIPTGIDPDEIFVSPEEAKARRHSLGIDDSDILIGTCCFLRSWKGIPDLLAAAQILKPFKQIKWLIVGGGDTNNYQKAAENLGLKDQVIFTGHLDRPFPSIAAMDIFTLLSTESEGISQATLQAAFLGKPMVTTNIGGLPEACIDGHCGIVIPPHSPSVAAEAFSLLAHDPQMRAQFGLNARNHALTHYTLTHTLDSMEAVYDKIK